MPTPGVATASPESPLPLPHLASWIKPALGSHTLGLTAKAILLLQHFNLRRFSEPPWSVSLCGSSGKRPGSIGRSSGSQPLMQLAPHAVLTPTTTTKLLSLLLQHCDFATVMSSNVFLEMDVYQRVTTHRLRTTGLMTLEANKDHGTFSFATLSHPSKAGKQTNSLVR